MACEVRGRTIRCGPGLRTSLGICAECAIHPATLLCDGPLPRGIVHRRSAIPGADKTCSKPLCRSCATHVEPDKDYCSEHKDPATRRLAL